MGQVGHGSLRRVRLDSGLARGVAVIRVRAFEDADFHFLDFELLSPVDCFHADRLFWSIHWSLDWCLIRMFAFEGIGNMDTFKLLEKEVKRGE